MRLYLIRHPKPQVAADVCYGRRDLAVSPEDLEAAILSVRGAVPAEVLAEAAILTSPLARCRVLAEALAHESPPNPSEELLEVDFGRWDGLPWSEVPRAELDAWAQDHRFYRPGGGESVDMVAARFRQWAQQRYNEGASCAIAVTHAGVIRVARACASGSWAECFDSAPIGFGAVHCLEVGPGYGS